LGDIRVISQTRAVEGPENPPALRSFNGAARQRGRDQFTVRGISIHTSTE
jgi:hypothetical protein